MSARRVGWIAMSLVVLTWAAAFGAYALVRQNSDPTGPQGSFSTGLTRFAPDQRGDPVELAGQTLDGAPLDLAAWRRQVVVINVWGSWCSPCRKEASDLAAVYQQTHRRGVQFVGIDVRDQVAAAKSFTDAFGIKYPSLFDEDSSLLLTFSGSVPVSAIPSTLVLDQQGRVAATVVGVVDRTTLKGLVTDLLAEGRQD